MSLPDPLISHGPYRPFTVDPDWDDAWWWLAIPMLFAVWLIVMWRVAPAWYSKWIIRLRHTRIFPVHHPAGRASHSRAALVQALRAEATICFRRYHHRGAGLHLYRRGRDELGSALLPLEDTRILGNGEPPARDQSTQHLSRFRAVAADDCRAWRGGRRYSGAACSSLPPGSV
jgi:hypothetical protein